MWGEPVHTFSVDWTQVARRSSDFGRTPQRLEARGLAVLPVVIRADGREHVGVLRDISRTGMFFYCSTKPAVDSELEITIRPSVADSSVMVRCRCKVVRVELSVPGAATGVAVTIQEYLTSVIEGDIAELVG